MEGKTMHQGAPMAETGPMAGDMAHMAGHGAHMGAMPSLALVDPASATHRAVASGDWSDPATWEGGAVPGDGARAIVPAGIEVRVDGVLAPELKTLRIDGLLSFATDRNTELRVDTVVSSATGELRIGTAQAPVEAGVTARLVFADDGPIDRDWDPGLISRGALLHGKTEIHGAEKTAFEAVANPPMAGDTTLTLGAVPVGWAVGDEIVVAGTDAADPESDETVTIAAIDGATITLDRPLERDHAAPDDGLAVHVANLTRNIVVTSEDPGPLQRGHVMFMHTNDVDAQFVRFHDLGRTDKRAGVDDWVLESGNEDSIGVENLEIQDLGGSNVRGRYSVHFHQAGSEGEGLVNGAVVTDDPGWAYVNHSSHVHFTNNVSHNIVGAAYNTEAGDELGSFIGNIALRTVNPEANLNPAYAELDPDQAPDARADAQDYGFQGDGFWFHGSGVTVEDNVVSGASGHAYIYWQLGLVEKGLGEKLVDVATLPDGDLIGPDGTLVRTKQVPVPSFDGNEAYAATKGLQIHYLHTDNRDGQDAEFVADGTLAAVPQAYEETLQSSFTGSTFWNLRLSGIDAPYSGRLTFEDIRVIGTGEPGSVGIRLDHFANQNTFTVRDVEAEGFQIGLAAPRQGEAVIDGATLANQIDLLVISPDTDPRSLEISDLNFAPGGESGLEPGDMRQNILLDPSRDFAFDGGLFGDDAGVGEGLAEDTDAPGDTDGDERDGDEGDGDGAGDDAPRIAFVGDSITDAPEPESFLTYLPDLLGSEAVIEPVALGGSGITDAVEVPIQSTEAFEALLDEGAEIVWIMIGGNDLAGGASAEDYEDALEDVVGALSETASDPLVVIAAQPPFFEATADEIGLDGAAAHEIFRDEWVPAMERVAEASGAIFLDINEAVPDYPDNYPDLIHPDEAGAETLAKLIAPELDELLAPSADDADDEEDETEEDDDAPEDGISDDDGVSEDDGESEDDPCEVEEEEGPEGAAPAFLPDRITLTDGDTTLGLYFDEQAPDAVPLPAGSELAGFLPPELAGLTNAELQARFGVSFADALQPEDAAPLDGLTGGVAGSPLPAFDPFPPEIEVLFTQDTGDGASGDTDPETAGTIVTFYLVFYGRMPDAAGFGFWQGVVSETRELDTAALAAAFAHAGEFAALFEGMEPGEIVAALYANLLGRAPDAAGLAHWTGMVEADNGFGLTDLGAAFATADETAEIHADAIDAFLEEMAGGDGPSLCDDAEEAFVFIEGTEGDDRLTGGPERDEIEGGPGDDTIEGAGGFDLLIGGPGADVFVFGPSADDLIVDFEPGVDRLDLRSAGIGFAEIEVVTEPEGTLLLFGEGEVFLDGVSLEAADLAAALL